MPQAGWLSAGCRRLGDVESGKTVRQASSNHVPWAAGAVPQVPQHPHDSGYVAYLAAKLQSRWRPGSCLSGKIRGSGTPCAPCPLRAESSVTCALRNEGPDGGWTAAADTEGWQQVPTCGPSGGDGPAASLSGLGRPEHCGEEPGRSRARRHRRRGRRAARSALRARWPGGGRRCGEAQRQEGQRAPWGRAQTGYTSARSNAMLEGMARGSGLTRPNPGHVCGGPRASPNSE
jgi:hypothetical protein